MMSCIDSINEDQKEYREFSEFFNKVGFEIIGSKIINDEVIYLFRKKKRSS